MFAGHFLGLVFTQADAGATMVSLQMGPHCRAADGRISLAALSILADVAMAAAVRGEFGHSARVATLTIRLSLASLPADGALRAVARLQTIPRAGAMQSASASVDIHAADGSLCCSGAATFAVLENRQGTADHPMPRDSTLCGAPVPRVEELDAAEWSVWRRAMRAEQDAGPAGFIEPFWGIVPVAGATPGQASCRVESGLHVGNRSGHFQGGILLGAAALTCAAAVPADWHLLDLSGQYLEAGIGTHIAANAATLRSGRNLAFVECHVADSKGLPIFSAQASCVRGQ